MINKHFVEFYSPGTFVAETTTREIYEWDVDEAVRMLPEINERYGAKPYAFRFITRGRADDELDSRIIDTSHYFFINGVVKTLEEIKAEHNPDNKILILNMKGNNWNRVITTMSPYKWTQPFNEDDFNVVIKEDGSFVICE